MPSRSSPPDCIAQNCTTNRRATAPRPKKPKARRLSPTGYRRNSLHVLPTPPTCFLSLTLYLPHPTPPPQRSPFSLSFSSPLRPVSSSFPHLRPRTRHFSSRILLLVRFLFRETRKHSPLPLRFSVPFRGNGRRSRNPESRLRNTVVAVSLGRGRGRRGTFDDRVGGIQRQGEGQANRERRRRETTRDDGPPDGETVPRGRLLCFLQSRSRFLGIRCAYNCSLIVV